MFKLVCGAGNEDYENVKRLVYVYAKAGCKLFDLSARKDILEASKKAVELAGASEVEYCVSIGIKGDKHIRKAQINESDCIKCANCYKNCPQNAIYSSILVDEKKCIGCDICYSKCPVGAINMIEKDINYNEVLPYMVKNGVNFLELHIMGHDSEDLKRKWKVINDCNPKFASICIDRENFGNKEVLSKIKDMISLRKPYTTIVQADGIPMSGGDDSYKSTLQAVAMAEIVQNANLPVYIMLSGGTNSKTAKLAHLCGINYWGIAIGSYARKIVKPYLLHEDFWNNNDIQIKAIEKAKKLIEKNS